MSLRNERPMALRPKDKDLRKKWAHQILVAANFVDGLHHDRGLRFVTVRTFFMKQR